MIQSNLALLLGFFSGSIPFGIFIAKIFGVQNLRSEGSGNIGATNVTRVAGWKAGALTYIFDFLKGFLPMYLIQCTIHSCGPSNVWIGVAAVIGHCFSPFLKFNGGKGVATSFGFLFSLNPWLGLASLLVYVLTLATLKTSALGSLFSMTFALIITLLIREATAEKLAFVLIYCVVIFRHQSNWDALLKKTNFWIFLPVLFFTIPDRARATTDFLNHEIDTSQSYHRIVALMPSIAETLTDLGLENDIVAAPENTALSSNLKKK